MDERHEKFYATELGALYRQYDQALIDYWRREQDDGVSSRRLNELDRRAREARKAFVDKLMELVGA
jgi:hypothetical protein